MVEEAVGGAEGPGAFFAGQELYKRPRDDVQCAEPDGHGAFAAVVEKGGREEVPVGGATGPEPVEHLEAVTPIAPLHRGKKPPLAREQDLLSQRHGGRIDGRPQGAQALSDPIEGARGCPGGGGMARAGINR